MLKKYMSQETINEFNKHYKESKWWFKKNAFQDMNLFTWESLSDIVSTHDFNELDLVFAKSQLQFNPLNRKKKKFAHTVNISKIFSDYVKEGHTLILNSAHRWHPPLSKFCLSLGHELNTYTQTNMYASWSKDKGAFGKHWDEHDALIIQLDGRKHWKMFGKADENAVSHEYSKGMSETLLSEFVMEKGDILYIPMGQVHSVEMEDDISLHATVGIRRLTGLDLFAWLKEEVASLPEFRKRIPDIKDKAELTKFMEVFFKNLSTIQWDAKAGITSVESHIKSKISTRPYISFPNVGLSSENKQLDNKKFAINSFITYMGDHKSGLKVSDGVKKWVVPSSVAVSFKQLLDGELVDYDSIYLEGLNKGIDKNMIEKICSDMLDEGVVTLHL
ncbi:putative ribosomal oxygenase [compost metagenome]